MPSRKPRRRPVSRGQAARVGCDNDSLDGATLGRVTCLGALHARRAAEHERRRRRLAQLSGQGLPGLCGVGRAFGRSGRVGTHKKRPARQATRLRVLRAAVVHQHALPVKHAGQPAGAEALQALLQGGKHHSETPRHGSATRPGGDAPWGCALWGRPPPPPAAAAAPSASAPRASSRSGVQAPRLAPPPPPPLPPRCLAPPGETTRGRQRRQPARRRTAQAPVPSRWPPANARHLRAVRCHPPGGRHLPTGRRPSPVVTMSAQAQGRAPCSAGAAGLVPRRQHQGRR